MVKKLVKRKIFDKKYLGGKADKKKSVKNFGKKYLVKEKCSLKNIWVEKLIKKNGKKITSQFWVKIFIAKKSFG